MGPTELSPSACSGHVSRLHVIEKLQIKYVKDSKRKKYIAAEVILVTNRPPGILLACGELFFCIQLLKESK